MPLNFVEIINNYFNPGFREKVGKSLNESQEGISEALSLIIPAGLGSILNMATSGKEGANGIYDMAKSATWLLSSIPDIHTLERDDVMNDFISGIFGANQSFVIDSISNSAGIQKSSTFSLLKMTIPYIMGFCGKYAEQNNLSANGLSGFLSSQHNTILQALPAEISSLNIMPDIHSLVIVDAAMQPAPIHNVTKTVNEMERISGVEKEERSGVPKWLPVLILVIVVIMLIWYFTKGN